MAEPNDRRQSGMDPVEGARDTADVSRDDREASERYDEGTEGAGISNRPTEEEIERQRSLPERGDAKRGGHAS